MIIGLAQPAEKRELPPPMEGPPDQTMVDKLFNNYWGADAADHWARFSPQWECDEHARAWPRRALRVVACCLIIRIPIIAVIAILPGINVAVR